MSAIHQVIKITVLTVAMAVAVCPIRTMRADSLTTTFAGGNSDEGEMFDILALKAINVTGLQMAFNTLPLTDTIDVFTKKGTFVGSEGTPTDWTLTSSSSVTVAALNVASPVITFTTPIALAPGERLGIYIRRGGGLAENVAYTNGDGTGTVEAIDSKLIIFEGVGVDGSFGSTNANRIPNVTMQFSSQLPEVTIIGRKRVTTDGSGVRVPIFGLGTPVGEIDKIIVRFKKERANGTTKNVKRNIEPDEDGIFRASVKSILGKNRVRFQAEDNLGQKSSKETVIITGLVTAS
jgi:hypothetical protein